jgi:hypothetical protein
MPRFYVVAREVQFYFARGDAEDEEKAAQLANELTEQELEYLDGGEWEIVNIEKIHEKPKQTKLF